MCFYCKTKMVIHDDEHDDTVCLCGEEAWVEENEYNKIMLVHQE